MMWRGPSERSLRPVIFDQSPNDRPRYMRDIPQMPLDQDDFDEDDNRPLLEGLLRFSPSYTARISTWG